MARPTEPDEIAGVVVFASGEEMEEWLKDPANLSALKRQYNPRTHSCVLNKAAFLITILKGKIDR